MHYLVKTGIARLIVVVSLFVSSTALYAQKTLDYTSNIDLFEHGKMMYLKELYVPAISDFEAFLKTKPQANLQYEAEAYIQLSRLKLGKKKAPAVLAKTIKEQPEHKINTEITYELGLYYFNDGKYKRALRYLEDINDKDVSGKQRDELIFKKGYSYFQEGEYENAKKEFAKIINGSSTYAVQANYYYGYQCYVLKDYACALNTFEKIGDKGPKTMKIYIAQIYYEQEEYEKAFEIVKNLKIESKQNDIELLLGKIHYQLGNHSIALSHFNKYEGEVSDLFSDEIYQFAHANYLAGNYDKSKEYYLLISNLEDAVGQAANYFLGISYVETSKKNRALNAFAEATRKNFDPQITEVAAFNYAKLAAELQKNNIAIKAIQKFLNDYPDSEYQSEAQSIMASIYLSTKNYKAAIEVLEKIPNMDNKTKVAYQVLTYHRAEELYLNNEFQNAHVLFLKSLKHPMDKKLEAQAYFWLGEIAYKLGDFDESINQLNRFVSNSGAKLSDEKNYAYYSLGYNYFKKKDYAKAQNYFSQFKKKESYTLANKDIYLDNSQRLADCYFLNRQYREAINEYSVIINKNYKAADYALFQKGMLHGLVDESDQKINTLKRIQKDFPRSVYVDDALFQIGREYMEMENYNMAESMFKLLISQHDYSKYLAESYLKLGLIYYNQSKDDIAMGYYKSVVERFPKTSASNEALSFIEIIYIKQGKGEEWIAYASSVNADVRVSNQDSIIYESAMVKYRKGDCAGAVKDFKNYINKFGDNGYFIIAVNYYKAECDFYNGRENEALGHYEYVANQRRNDFSEKSNLKLAQAYFNKKKYGKAIDFYAALELLASNRTNFIEALLGQMRCYYLTKDYEKSKAKAIELLPVENVPKENLVEANMTLGRIQLLDNNLRTAKFHFEYVINESRNILTAEAIYHTAFIQYQQNELDSSRENVYKLNDDFSAYEYWVVKGFILLSDIYVKEQDFFQAKATLQSILDNYTKEDDGILDICRMKLKAIEDQE